MKSSRVIFYIIALFVLVLVIYIGKESFFQPGLDRFEGKYEELGFYRNENNTGPVLRIYAIRVLQDQPEEEWMREFAESRPHTKYGKTLVYFFESSVSEKIELKPDPPFFPENLESAVVASFERTPMGEPRFVRGLSK